MSQHILDVFADREMIAQITHPDTLRGHLATPGRTAYIGYDPTAESLHVGHLLTIMGLRRWQQAGHRVVVLMGGGTALVGDPTGKTEMRQMLTADTIVANIAAFKRQAKKFLELDDPQKGVILNNADWLRDLNYLNFLREIGPHFSVNRMLTAECFKTRLEKGLSFLEFNYMLLQSYDFLHLYRHESCTVQMGGDDQWSNMLGGMELVRRLAKDTEASEPQSFCLTFPLLATADGKKMGKTEKGAVWLDQAMTSPYEYFQFWRNIDDSLVRSCLLTFTELSRAEVDQLTSGEGAAINQAKETLAVAATGLNHGEEEARRCLQTARELFAGAGSGGNEPEFVLSASSWEPNMPLVDLLVASGMFASKGEVRRLIKQNGLVFAGEKVLDPQFSPSRDELSVPEGVQVKKGKKHYYRLRFSE